MALFSIANLIGPPLKLDASTANLFGPSVARVCVELDLRNPRLEKIWIVNGDSGFWQPITYEGLPLFCSIYQKIGHDQSLCRSQDSRQHSSLNPGCPAPKAHFEYRPKPSQASDKHQPNPHQTQQDTPKLLNSVPDQPIAARHPSPYADPVDVASPPATSAGPSDQAPSQLPTDAVEVHDSDHPAAGRPEKACSSLDAAAPLVFAASSANKSMDAHAQPTPTLDLQHINDSTLLDDSAAASCTLEAPAFDAAKQVTMPSYSVMLQSFASPSQQEASSSFDTTQSRAPSTTPLPANMVTPTSASKKAGTTPFWAAFSIRVIPREQMIAEVRSFKDQRVICYV